ncbi:MAG: hypothetical protein ABSF56_00200 [Minisyncoccia bacterium]|jgi:tetrahydromethanopterin S-methyltransferase subunit C
MNQRDGQLKRDVMTRVRAVYLLRRAFDPEALKGLVFAACAVAMVYLVSIPHVIQNMSRLSGVADDVSYLLSAFIHTSFTVEAVITLAIAAGLWLLFDIVHNLRYARPWVREA